MGRNLSLGERLAAERKQREKKLYKDVPKDIKAARKARYRRRQAVALAVFALYWVFFILGIVIPGTAGLALMSFAFTLSALSNAILYGLHERLLRQVAGRPQVDYAKIRKLERRELPKVPK